MRSNLLQQILAQAFHIPLGKRPPLWLILDEAEHVLSRDSGAIGTILAEGRSLGIHLCLLFHSFSQVREHNPELLPLLLTACKTKIIGGALYHDDLEALVNEMFITEWHPHIVRDEIYSLEVEPIEELRASRSFSRSRSIGKGKSISESVATGVSGAIAMGRSFAEQFGVSDAWSAAHSKGRNASVTASRQNSRSRNWQEGSSLTLSDSWGETEGESANWGAAEIEMSSSGLGGGTTTIASTGTGITFPQEFEGDRLGDVVRASKHEGTGRADSYQYMDGHSSGFVDSRGGSTSKTRSMGGGIARGTNVSTGTTEGEAEGLAAQRGTSLNETHGSSHTNSRSAQRGTNTTETTTRSKQEQTGTTISGSEEEGWTESITISPFHRLVKRWKVSSREFLSLRDFLATKLIAVKQLPRQHFAIKGPIGRALWFKVVTVRPFPKGRERLPAFWRTVFSKPWFQPVQREQATPLLLPEAGAQEGEPNLVYSQPRRNRKRKPKQ